jgi:hypothetical protein
VPVYAGKHATRKRRERRISFTVVPPRVVGPREWEIDCDEITVDKRAHPVLGVSFGYPSHKGQRRVALTIGKGVVVMDSDARSALIALLLDAGALPHDD